MTIFAIIYILLFIIVALIVFAIMQIKMAGLNVKDFWTFIEANEMLDKLYKFASRYEKLSPMEQLIFLKEAEKYLMHMKKFLKCYGKMSTKNTWKYLIHIKI